MNKTLKRKKKKRIKGAFKSHTAEYFLEEIFCFCFVTYIFKNAFARVIKTPDSAPKFTYTSWSITESNMNPKQSRSISPIFKN